MLIAVWDKAAASAFAVLGAICLVDWPLCRTPAVNGCPLLRRLMWVKRKCCERHQLDASDPTETSASNIAVTQKHCSTSR
jgi:hypothetical protein